MIRIYNVSAPTRALRPIWLCKEMDLPYEVVPVTFPPSPEYLSLAHLAERPAQQRALKRAVGG